MAEMWYYTSEGRQMEPVPIRALQRLAGDGILKPTDMVWREGLPRWVRASSLKELFPAASSAAAAVESDDNRTAPATNEPGPELVRPGAGGMEEREVTLPRRRRRPAGSGGMNTWVLVAFLIGGMIVMLALAIGIFIHMTAPGPQKMAPVGAMPMPAARVPAEPEVQPANPNENFVNDVLTYDVRFIPPMDLHEGAFPVQKGQSFEISVKSTENKDQWSVTIADQKLVKPVGKSPWRFTADADGECRLQLRRQNKNRNGPTTATVTITRQPGKAAAEKKGDPPLPGDLRTGAGAVPLALDLAPGGAHVVKFRVKAGHAAKITVTPLFAPGKMVELNLQILQDSDDTPIKAEQSRIGSSVRAEFTLPITQVVRVRIENTSKKANVTQLTLIYDVGN